MSYQVVPRNNTQNNMRQLNILIILETLNLGGAQTHVVTLSKALTLKGHNISIVSGGGELVEKVTSFGVRHYQLPLNKKSMLPYSTMHLIRIIKAEKISIVHSHPRLKPILTGYLASAISHIPCVTTVHTIFPVLFNYRYLNYTAEKIIAVSSEVKNYLTSNCKIKEENIEIVYNGIDLHDFMSPKKMKSESSSSYNALKILYISRLDKGKINAIINFINTIPILYKEVPNVKVVIVGTGTEFDKIESLVKEKNTQISRAVICMYGASKDVAKLMQSAEAVIGIGRVIIEAMACGKPAIVFGSSIVNHGGIEEHFGGIVTEENVMEMKEYNFTGRNCSDIASPDNIASAVIELATNEKKRVELGIFGRKFVEKELSIDKIAEQTEQIYLNIQRKRVKSSY
ncbi:glycosyltransferase family 4 protein [bacterium]|nr:glycosyltransferase family 4 protein [bacterium]